MSERAVFAAAWRDDIGARAFNVMRCTHDGDDFGDGAVCETCWANMQRVCSAVLSVAERAVISAAPPLNSELRHDGTPDPEGSAYVEGFHDALTALQSLRIPIAAKDES